jgi:hypothetical protein
MANLFKAHRAFLPQTGGIGNVAAQSGYTR